jgi:methionyl-tRNA formyltransferase
MSALRVIFMGSPAFAVPTLHALLASRHQVISIYTQPPRPAGRGQKLTPTPVAAIAAEQHLPLLTPLTLKSPEIQAEFAAHGADVAVVAAYGLLLPPPVLAAPRFGAINLHPSALPRWRGAAPIHRTLMAGDRTTACCLMQMEAGLDTGPVLARQEVAIADGTDAGMLEQSMAELGAQMMVEYLDQLAEGAAPVPRPQSLEGVTYAAKITKEELRLDWSLPAAALRQKILGLAPAPGAYTLLHGERVKIFRADLAESSPGTAPGTVLDGRSLTIQCGAGTALRLREIQRPGQRRGVTEEVLKSFVIQDNSLISDTDT